MGLKIGVLKNEEEKMVILMLSGPLDTETYQDFKDKAKAELEKNPKALVLDLKSLDYISSMGISAILETRKICDAKKISFMLSNVPGHIEQVFKIVNALPDVPMFENMEEADKYFLEIQKRIKNQS